MSWNGKLSSGAIRAIFQENNDVASPVLQVLQIKKITGPNGEPTMPERYRVVISDGAHHHSFMLATQRNHLITDEVLVKNSIVRLDEYNTNEVRGRKIMIVLRLERLAGPQAPIGSPAAIDGADQSPHDSPISSFPSPLPAPTTAAPAPFQSVAPAASSSYQQPPSHFPQQQQQQQQPFRAPGFGGPASSSSASSAGGGYGHRGGFGGGHHHAPGGGPQASSSTAGSVDEVITEDMVIPIKVLSPYRHRWAIKGRVTSKSPVRTWTNQRGAGKLFKVDLADAEGGEISISCFNATVDKFFPIFEEGQVYLVSRGTVKGANKKFSSGNSIYEITLDQSSVVQQAPDQANIPRVNWAVTKIADLKDHPKESPVTVIGVILEAHDAVTLPSKQRQGETLHKRSFTIGDKSGHSIEISVWGEQKVADLDAAKVGSLVGFKNAKLGDYNGMSLSCWESTYVDLNPDTPLSHELLGWYTGQHGQSHIFTPLTTGGFRGRQDGGAGGAGGAGGERKDITATCSDVRTRMLGSGTTADWFHLRGTVTSFRKDNTFYYRSCPTEKCNKKVTGEPGQFHCEKCQTTFHDCSHRYILGFNVTDHTGQIQLTAFNDGAQLLLNNQSADTMAALKEGADYPAVEAIFDAATFKAFKFKCRAFSEEYNGERRIKYSVASLAPPDFVADSKEMISRIRAVLPKA